MGVSIVMEVPKLWLVFVRENPNLKRMMTGGTPMTSWKHPYMFHIRQYIDVLGDIICFSQPAWEIMENHGKSIEQCCNSPTTSHQSTVKCQLYLPIWGFP